MKTNLYDQHSEHTEWLKNLNFYVDEMTIMQKRLEDISSKNSGLEVRKEIEHFQNQFIIQTKFIDDMKRNIKLDEKVIMANINSNPVASDHRKAEDHTKERDMMKSFESNFADIRKEFNLFLSKRS